MKIAVVIERFDPVGGGAERSTAQIVGELTKRGHRVTLITGSASDEVTLPGARIERLSKHHASGPTRLLRFVRWAGDRLGQGAYDTSLSVTTALPAAVVQPRSGTMRETLDRNIAMRSRRVDRMMKQALSGLSPKRQLLLALERRTIRHPSVRRFAAVSRYVAEQLQRHYRVASDRIEVIANAAAMPKLDEAQRAAARRAIRGAFGIDEHTPVYLFAAHNPRLKGIATLLGALRMMKLADQPGVALLVGQPRYGVQEQSVALDVRDRVRIVGASNRMAELYAASDVTVLPTWYDPSSKVVIESLMLGIPAITTTFNGAADFVTPPDGAAPRGRVINHPADVAALAQAMRELASDAEQDRCRAAIGDLAQQLSMQRHVDQLEALLATTASETDVASGSASTGVADGS